MGISRAVVASAAKAGFNAAGEAIVDVIYKHVLSENYDTETRQHIKNFTPYTVPALIEDYDAHSVNEDTVLETDQKITILQDDLAITPLKNGLVIVNDIVYTIKNIKKDPLNIIWVFQCRA